MYGPPPKKPGTSTGIIIAVVAGVALLCMVAIVGVLAVLGIYGTRKYIANAKTAEARAYLGMMGKDAVASFEEDDDAREGSPHRGGMCPSARSPIPATIQDVSAKKYQSTVAEWKGDPGFSCLGFEVSSPQYYQYNYTNTGSGFAGTARGDLNGDGVTSRFEIVGRVQDGSLVVAPSILETNPDE